LIRLCFAYFGYWRADGQYEGTEAVVFSERNLIDFCRLILGLVWAVFLFGAELAGEAKRRRFSRSGSEEKAMPGWPLASGLVLD
jgi:hypothetical protein